MKPSKFTKKRLALEAETTGRVAQVVTSLPLKDIRTAEDVFQVRDVEYAALRSEQHIKTLAAAIVDAPGHVLDPLLVWWSGKQFYVIDGHHRLKAYKRAKAEVPIIPVRTFDGTLDQAIGEAAAGNCRDKLPMSLSEKMERAWKLVCLPDSPWTKGAIHRATGASVRTVANMRAKRKELHQKGRSNLLDLSWEAAKRGEARETGDEDWEEHQAVALQKRLVKMFGDTLAKQSQITAMALEMYSSRLKSELIEYWAVEAEQMLKERETAGDEMEAEEAELADY